MSEIDDLIAQHLIADTGEDNPDSWRFKVLLAVADRGDMGAADSELNAILKAPGLYNNLRPRRIELTRQGLLVDSGTKRPTVETGRPATVWVLSDSVRGKLTPALDQMDCELASIVDSGNALSHSERQAQKKLRAKLGLLARRAIRACADADMPVTATMSETSIGFRAYPVGQDPNRVMVDVSLHGDGLELDLIIGNAEESSGAERPMERRRQLRTALATLDAELLRPIAELIEDGWVCDVAEEPDAERMKTELPDWLELLATQPELTGTVRRRIASDELDDVAAVIQRVINLTLATMQIASMTTAAFASDPVQALMTQLFWPEERAQRLVDLARRAKQLLFTGPPGTGKTLAARALAAALAEPGDVRLVQFHPSYAYEDFVEGIRPVIVSDSGPTNVDTFLSYEIRSGVFKLLVATAAEPAATSKKFFLIIDEINRANLARVLGELLFALEYRGTENQVELPYSRESFFVPDNLWIIGTMNTADRSVALMDAAMRRRFKEVRFGIDLDALLHWHETNTSTDLGQEAVLRLSRLNQQVAELLDDDRTIGQSYLMRKDLAVVGFHTIWDEDIEPVLRDHLLGRSDDLPGLRAAFLDW